MKTTVDIPQDALEDAIRFSGASTKREAIVTAIEEFNQRHRMRELLKYVGTCEFVSSEELQRLRRAGQH